MKRDFHRWHSPALQRDMEMLVFGHAGARMLVFPTSMGRFFDWENRGLVAALADRINAGRLQCFCLDSVDAESWYAAGKHPAERVRRHQQYDDYLAGEAVPFSISVNPNPLLIVVGASFGGYHAVNFGLRHPELVGRVLSLSGLCDIRRFCDGHYDDAVYFHNPVDFIANEHDARRLESLRRLDIILAVGRDDALAESNVLLSNRLWDKGVWHALRIWDGFAHDWPYWETMLHCYIGGHEGKDGT